MISIDISFRWIDEELQKSKITEQIIRSLPDWFGIEDAIKSYIEEVKKQTFICISVGEVEIGFCSYVEHNSYTAEIYVMGILPEFHRFGLGHQLIEFITNHLRALRFQYLMVKTLGESHPDLYYAKTRNFYLKEGFIPLEEIQGFWGKNTPCLIMIKGIS